MTLKSYLNNEKYWVTFLWFAFILINTVTNVVGTTIASARNNLQFELWQLISWEVSSGLMWLLLLPVVIIINRRFPLALIQPKIYFLWHFISSVAVSVGHVFGMVVIRKIVYSFYSKHYDFGSLPIELFYEYLQDFRTYSTIIAIIYLYRFVLHRLQGDAEFIGASDDPEAKVSSEWILVKKLKKEFLIKIEEIEWIESNGNYVNLHTVNQSYLVRQTMKNIDIRTQPYDFIRIHRTAIVNINKISQIEPSTNGDGIVRMYSGSSVPISRRYRKTLLELTTQM